MDFPLDPEFPYYLAESDLTELDNQFPHGDGIDWSRFLFFGEEHEVAPGEFLIQQFDCDSNIFVLTHGELEVRIATNRGEPGQPIATIEPIAVIGELGFLDDGPRTASVVGTKRSTVYRLTRAAFDDMRRTEPDVAWAFMLDISRSLSRRARGLIARQTGL